MMLRKLVEIIGLIFFLLFNQSCHSGNAQQESSVDINDNILQLMFYNVENLFDINDDTLKNDNDFLPEAARYWTRKRYEEKIRNIYKVFTAAGKWSPPDIIGLCEVENSYVLNDLINNTPFSKFEYNIIHYNSPDNRGIDVALVFNKEKFDPIVHESVNIFFPQNPKIKTRDILYVKGKLMMDDTLHLFVNHWPSRRGGQVSSEHKRIKAATVLRNITDSIFAVNPRAKIVIMGDFNDESSDKSISGILGAISDFTMIQNEYLYTFVNQGFSNNIGTHKYKGNWSFLDQFIISGSLLSSKQGLYCNQSDFSVFKADFLLIDDDKYSGKKPFRTYNGYKYQGGYSDHLPILLDLHYK